MDSIWFGMFCDLTKAYNILNHKILLEELYSNGIMGSTNSRFQSYLANRCQFVEINCSDARNIRVNRYRSSYTKIRHGVLQESVPGPLLLLLYVNDLPFNMHGANLVYFCQWYKCANHWHWCRFSSKQSWSGNYSLNLGFRGMIL